MDNLIALTELVNNILSIYNEIRSGNDSDDKNNYIEKKCQELDAFSVEKAYERKRNLIKSILHCREISSRSYVVRTAMIDCSYECRVEQLEKIIDDFNDLFTVLMLEHNEYSHDINDLMSQKMIFENVWREYFYCSCNKMGNKDEWFGKLIDISISLEDKLMKVLSDVRDNIDKL